LLRDGDATARWIGGQKRREVIVRSARVLVVEDDPAIRRGVVDCLTFAGYTCEQAGDGQAGLDAALAGAYELILLDILMPRLDGLAVLREIRKARPTVPIIMLTAKGEEADKVRGLREGADDYVVKPFGPKELIARVEAVLRRSPERPLPVRTVKFPGGSIDLERREVCHEGRAAIVLSEKEAQVLAYLIMHPGRTISRDELLRRVWDLDPHGVHTRAVDMAVARLRDILRDDADNPRFIQTVRGKGYAAGDALSRGAENPA
jgi:DNA-binding response OmpR family regulator